jgi:hypothetical protein
MKNIKAFFPKNSSIQIKKINKPEGKAGASGAT